MVSRALIGELVLLVVACGAIGQEIPTLRSQSNVVLVPALVKDQDGQVIYGLTADDFVIEDDGVPQAVELEDSVESDPVSVILVIQTGRRASREFSRIQGLSALVSPLLDQPHTRMALLEFDSHVQITRDFSEVSGDVDRYLQDLQPGDNGAVILDALNLAINLLGKESEDRKRVLLLVSEMRDHGSHIATIDDIVAAVGKNNIVMHTIAYSPAISQVLDTERGANRDETGWNAPPDLLALLALARNSMKKNVAKTISQMTGGEYEEFATRKHFEQDMTGFTNHIHSRYMLSFTPHDPHAGLHQIRVRMRQPRDGVSIVARTSYWAEGSPADR